MICFRGNLSGSAEKHEIKFSMKIVLISSVIVTGIFVPVWLALLTFGGADNPILSTIIISLVFGGAYPIIVLFITKIKAYRSKYFYINVFYDGEFLVSIDCKGNETFRLASEATCVKDYGEFYQVFYGIMRFPICQKDLLVSGTLEEFEALFEGKIVRVNEEEREK